MELAGALSGVETALADGDAQVVISLGGQREETSARLWRGQVLVDWEPDATAGGCLLRPDLLRRLVALHAAVRVDGQSLAIQASGQIVAALSPEHADLVRRLGGTRP